MVINREFDTSINNVIKERNVIYQNLMKPLHQRIGGSSDSSSEYFTPRTSPSFESHVRNELQELRDMIQNLTDNRESSQRIVSRNVLPDNTTEQ